MSVEDALRDCDDIFKNIMDYALVKIPQSQQRYRILHIPSMGWELIEGYSDIVIAKMIELGVRIVDHEDEVRPPDFKRTYPVWSEEKKTFVKLSQEEFDEWVKQREIDRMKRKFRSEGNDSHS